MNEPDRQELIRAAQEIRRTAYNCGYKEGSAEHGVEDKARREMENATTAFLNAINRIKAANPSRPVGRMPGGGILH